MAQLSELLVTKIHAQQRLNQMRQAQEFMAVWQKEWVTVRSAYSRLTRHGVHNGASEEEFWTSEYPAKGTGKPVGLRWRQPGADAGDERSDRRAFS